MKLQFHSNYLSIILFSILLKINLNLKIWISIIQLLSFLWAITGISKIMILLPKLGPFIIWLRRCLRFFSFRAKLLGKKSIDWGKGWMFLGLVMDLIGFLGSLLLMYTLLLRLFLRIWQVWLSASTSTKTHPSIFSYFSCSIPSHWLCKWCHFSFRPYHQPWRQQMLLAMESSYSPLLYSLS